MGHQHVRNLEIYADVGCSGLILVDLVALCRPLSAYNWKPLLCLNLFLMAFFFSTSAVTGLVYAIKQLITNMHTFHWFAACYQCPEPVHAGL